MEAFEKNYLDNFEKCEAEYTRKYHAISTFKRLALYTSDNCPMTEFLPFVKESSIQLSSDIATIAAQMTEYAELFRAAPVLTWSESETINSLNQQIKFFFKNQTVFPPNKTDPSKNMINIDPEKIINAINFDDQNLEKKQFNPLGPLFDGDVFQLGGPISKNLSIPLVNAPAPRQTFSLRGNLPAATTQNRTPSAQGPYMLPQRMAFDPRAVLGRSLQQSFGRPSLPPLNPVVTRPVRPDVFPRKPNPARADLRLLNLPRPTTPISNSNSNNSNSINNITLPNLKQQPQQRLSNGSKLMLSNLGNLSSSTKAPAVANVLTANPDMQKQLNDFLNQKSGPPPSTVSRIPVVMPNQCNSNDSYQPPAKKPHMDLSSPSTERNPALPPIKLTLKRNTLNSSTEDSQDKPSQKTDEWDDYCFVCNQGCDEQSGELVCCESCPKVYHNVCHIPRIQVDVKDLPDDWRCMRCKSVQLQGLSDKFTEREQLLCSKVLLYCYETPDHSEPFHNPIPRTVPRYYDVIKRPICFKEIGVKISDLKYTNIVEFIEDMNQVFINCVTFNKVSFSTFLDLMPVFQKGTPVEESGRHVYSLYTSAVRNIIPAYQPKIWLYHNSYKPS